MDSYFQFAFATGLQCLGVGRPSPSDDFFGSLMIKIRLDCCGITTKELETIDSPFLAQAVQPIPQSPPPRPD
jgi:hypothetical protein